MEFGEHWVRSRVAKLRRNRDPLFTAAERDPYVLITLRVRLRTPLSSVDKALTWIIH